MRKTVLFDAPLLLFAILLCAVIDSPAQTLKPTALSFGNQVVNTSSSAKSITLTNSQTTPLTITSVTTAGDFRASSLCPISPNTLAAAASCTISVTFTPTALGTRSGTLTISDNASNSPQTAALSGAGVVPVALPSSFSFRPQVINTSSTPQSLRLTNNRTTPLNISSITISGDFTQTSNCPTVPAALPARSGCTIFVTFRPTALGVRTGRVTVTDNATNSPQTTALNGSGILPVVFSTNSIGLGNQIVNLTSAAKSVKLTNNQNIPLAITSIGATGDFAQSSNCPLTPSTLPAAGSCTISVTFTPTALGPRTGSVSVVDNAANSPQVLSVSGSGTLSGLVGVVVSPPNTSVAAGTQQQYVATGSFSNGATSDVTKFVGWSSSLPGVATINSSGLASAVAQGTTLIKAVSGSILGSTGLTVTVVQTSATATTITSSLNPSQLGQSVTFTATVSSSGGVPDGTVTLTDGTTVLANLVLSGGTASFTTTALSSGAHGITATYNATLKFKSSSAFLNQIVTPAVPTHFRVDISVGTTGQLFVSWDPMKGATYYNLQRSTNPASGYAIVGACSGLANLQHTQTFTAMIACRDDGLAVGTFFFYQVQACNAAACSNFSTAVSNVPVACDCTPAQMPDVSSVKSGPTVTVRASVVDPNITFQPTDLQYAGYAAPGVARRDLLVVFLPGSGTSCSLPAFPRTAQSLGFDAICVEYPNAVSQDTICAGDPACFGNVSQAKFDATGPCSVANGPHCGIDPKTGQPFVNSNPSDAVTQRISTMLQYLNNNGFNANGTNWSNYLSGTTPRWDKLIIGGHSQGGAMGTFAGYKQAVARVFNLSAPPAATPVNNVMTAATYLSTPKATNIRDFYGYVSTNDLLYQQGRFQATWQALGFTAANNDVEVQLNTATPVGLNCNSGIPSHNFSTSAPVSPNGAHNDTLPLWSEDVFKFMLLD